MSAGLGRTVSPGAMRAVERLRAWSRRVAVAVALVALLGWASGLTVLAGGFGGHPTMKVDTALAILALGIAAYLVVRHAESRAGAVLAALGGAVGALAIAEYVFGFGRGIDQLLVHDPAASYPGRPAANTAVFLVFAGAALLLAPRRRVRAALLGQALALIGLTIVAGALVGLATGTKELYGGSGLAYMSVSTMAALAALSLAVLFVRLDVGLGRAMVRDDVEGKLLRRQLPVAVLFPLALAFAREMLINAGLDEVFARWLYTLAVAVVLGLVVAVMARALGRSERAARVTSERLRAVVESSPLAVFTLDTEMRVTSWNPAAESMFGWTASEIVGRPYPLAGVQTSAEAVRNFARASADAFTVERTRRRKNGSEIVVEFASAPLRAADGALEGVLSVAADVTERARARDELRRSNEELEWRVRERTAQLSAANEELQAFSYSVSHDLRAPLRALGGFSEALLEDYGSQLDERAHDYLGRIQAAATRMSDLIDDVLVLSRVSRSEITRSEVDISALAAEVSAQAAAGEPRREVAVVIEPDMSALADASLVRQALQNLIENAWKFTAPVGHARIEVGMRDADGVREFYVADNGVGFDEAYIDKLFRPFQRLHSTHDFPGNGVGLATVGSVVKRHGGRVRAESHGAGACFSFTLEPAPRAPQAAQLVATGGSHG